MMWKSLKTPELDSLMFGVVGMVAAQDLVISVYSHCPVIKNSKTKCINLNKIKC